MREFILELHDRVQRTGRASTKVQIWTSEELLLPQLNIRGSNVLAEHDLPELIS